MTLRAFAVLVILVAAFSARAAGDLNHPTGVDGLLLIDKLGGHVRFFDPSTFKERSAVKVPANPHDFALSPDRRLAYVPIYGDGVYGKNPNKGHEVYIFDLAARTVAGVIDIAPYRINKLTPCPQCHFRAVCRFDPGVNRYHVLQPMKRSEVFERVTRGNA